MIFMGFWVIIADYYKAKIRTEMRYIIIHLDLDNDVLSMSSSTIICLLSFISSYNFNSLQQSKDLFLIS